MLPIINMGKFWAKTRMKTMKVSQGLCGTTLLMRETHLLGS